MPSNISTSSCPTLRIGLTGGIASGKSTAARYFSDFGISVISADKIARDLLSKHSPVLQTVVKAFGSDILTNAQELDRDKLRQLIFSDQTARRQLDAITHPAIGKALLAAANQAHSNYVILEIPLLVETKMTDFVDRILVISIDRETQLSRIMQRDTCSREDAENAVAAQASLEQRAAVADDIIHNSGSTQKLQQQVALLHNKYLQVANQNQDLYNKKTGLPPTDLGLDLR